MKERFKRYLEREFRAIAPTEEAMEYRNEMLRKMMAKAQDLRIKGIEDEELIYDMVIDDLGDFRGKLIDFSKKANKTGQRKRQALFLSVLAVGYVLMITALYLIVSFATQSWPTSWLIMVGGVFLMIVFVACALAAVNFSKRKFWISRISLIVAEVLITVFVFLLLQILFHLHFSYIAFLAMVIILLAVDTLIALFTKSKVRFVELAFFIEVFCALLYVILCLTVLPTLWHPLWVLCLVGVFGIVAEIVIVLSLRNRSKHKEEKELIEKKTVETDESYYTKWDD